MISNGVYRFIGALTGAGPASLGVGRRPYRQEAGRGRGAVVSGVDVVGEADERGEAVSVA